MNDPGLITLVNKLQDVFTTVGVCGATHPRLTNITASFLGLIHCSGAKSNRFTTNSCGRISIKWKEFGVGEYRGPRLVGFSRYRWWIEDDADMRTAVCREELASLRDGPSFSS